MKKTLFWLPVFLVLASMTSCFELEDSINGPFRSWVTVFENDDELTFITDKGIYLEVSNPYDSSLYEVGDRGNLLYSLVDAERSSGSIYQVVTEEYNKATVKPYVHDTDGVFRDTRLASFSAAHVSENYLNVMVKTFDSDETVNTLELVRYADEETHLETDSLPVIRVRLQHNVASVKPTSTIQAVCFDLSDLKVEFPGKNAYILRFCWKSTNVEQEYDLRYDPS